MYTKWNVRLNGTRAWLLGIGLLVAGVAWFVQR
jgi:hypothetical protein